MSPVVGLLDEKGARFHVFTGNLVPFFVGKLECYIMMLDKKADTLFSGILIYCRRGESEAVHTLRDALSLNNELVELRFSYYNYEFPVGRQTG